MFYTDDHHFLDVFMAMLCFLFEEKIEAGLDNLVHDLDPGLAVAGVNDGEDTEVPLRQLQLPPHQGQGEVLGVKVSRKFLGNFHNVPCGKYPLALSHLSPI